MAGYTFSGDAVTRIRQTVRTVEGMQSVPQASRANTTPLQFDYMTVGKTDAEIPNGESGTVSVYSGTSWENLTDTGTNITAWNRDAKIEKSRFVLCWTMPWGFEITWADRAIIVANRSAQEIPAYGCMRITGSDTGVSVDDDGKTVVGVRRPTEFGAQFNTHLFNGPTAIPAYDPVEDITYYGEAQTGPIQTALYETPGYPTLGECLGPRDASWKLHYKTGGFRTVSVADTATSTTKVIASPMVTIRGVANSDISKGGYGGISVYWGESWNSATDTGIDVTAYAPYKAISSGKKLLLAWIQPSLWEIAEAES